MKFCGMTRPEDAAAASESGATFIGAILSESPRRVTPARAAEIFAAAGAARSVAVFRHTDAPALVSDARASGAGIVQLHGRFDLDEIAFIREEFEGEIWRVFPLDVDAPVLPEGWSELADATDAIVLDASSAGQSGGLGLRFDWREAAGLAGELRDRTTLVVAGGLDAANVGEVIARLAPSVVDVSSGIESAPGVKDPAKMKAFAEAVRSASIV
jgi:phosphoribosylanthranilate isomerase